MIVIDAPSIKFFHTAEGVTVAYAVHGSGPPLVVPAWWVSQLELDWQDDAYRHFFQALGQHFSVIRYDRPGTGLSDRNRSGFSLLDEYSTLLGLIDHLDLQELSLLGISCGGPAALLLAHSCPHRVQKLIFVGSFVFGGDIAPVEIQEALEALVLAHWGLGAKAILDLFDPHMQAETRRSISYAHRRSASAEMARKLLKLTFDMDVRERAEEVLTPTLVLHRGQDRTVSIDAGRRLAAAIPNAEFKTVEGAAHLPWVGKGNQRFLDEIIGFAAATGLECSVENSLRAQFRFVGSVWALSYRGNSAHLKDAIGLHDLHCLMAQPRQEFSSYYLYTGKLSVHESEQSVLVDRETIASCRRRLGELEQEKSLAAAEGDEKQYAHLDKEEEQLRAYLNSALGLGGRSRAFDSEREKMRKAVTARIRASIKRIAAVLPELGEHLQDSVKTGSDCSYHGQDGIRWLL